MFAPVRTNSPTATACHARAARCGHSSGSRAARAIVVALIDDSEATLKYFRREGAMIRLDPANTQELDYYLLPRLDLPEQEIRVSNKNSADFECFRFDDLTFFYGMSERERLQRRI